MRDTLKAIVRRDIPAILAALWDAKLWQESIADAHTLEPWHQTRDLTHTAAKANRLAKRYTRLHDKIRKANDKVERCANSAYAPTPCSLPTCDEADKGGCWWEGKKVRVRHEWYMTGTNDAVCRQCGVRAVLKANADLERTARSDGTLQDFVGPCPICGQPDCMGNECEPERNVDG